MAKELRGENGGFFLSMESALEYWKRLAKKRQEKIRNAIWELENNSDDRYITTKVIKTLKKRI